MSMDGRGDIRTATALAALSHDSASLHVAGSARYADDHAEPAAMVHLALGLSAIARGRIVSLDLAPVRAAPGVIRVLTAADVPGINDTGPVVRDEPAFAFSERAGGVVSYHGQALFLVVAETRDAARRAAKLAVAEYEEETPILSIDDATAAGSYLTAPYRMARGDAAAAIAAAPRRLSGRIDMGGQDHFYLEGQIAVATPGEGEEMHVLSSTQHPSEVQAPRMGC